MRSESRANLSRSSSASTGVSAIASQRFQMSPGSSQEKNAPAAVASKSPATSRVRFGCLQVDLRAGRSYLFPISVSQIKATVHGGKIQVREFGGHVAGIAQQIAPDNVEVEAAEAALHHLESFPRTVWLQLHEPSELGNGGPAIAGNYGSHGGLPCELGIAGRQFRGVLG